MLIGFAFLHVKPTGRLLVGPLRLQQRLELVLGHHAEVEVHVRAVEEAGELHDRVLVLKNQVVFCVGLEVRKQQLAVAGHVRV